MELGKKLRIIRKRHGYSLQRVADDLGTSKGYVSNVERGNVENISLSKAEDFANYYNISLTELLDKKDNWRKKLPDYLRKFINDKNINYLNLGLLAKEEGLSPKEASKALKFLGNLKNSNYSNYTSAIKKAKDKNLSEDKLIKIINAFTNI